MTWRMQTTLVNEDTDMIFAEFEEEVPAEFIDEEAGTYCPGCEQIISCSLTAFLGGEEGIWAGRLHTGSDVPKANTRRARMRALTATRKRTP